MKILSLYFKNINSLQGENRVDFDQAPLSDAGVFAITGPNGSGKTSLLDAITLGLYGETFRFDRPASHVMTRETGDSFAEVVFSTRGRQYRSSWRVQREGGQSAGGLMSPQMQLTALDEEEQTLASQPAGVREKIQQLTGMDFRAFTRSMVLAQGHFSAFLNALDNERMEILEKLISKDIYVDYQKQIQADLQQEKNKYAQIEQQLKQMPVVEEAVIQAEQEDLADFQAQLQVHQAEQDDLNHQKNWLNNIDRLQRDIVLKQKKLQQTQQQKLHVDQQLQHIEDHMEVLDLLPDVKALDNKAMEVKRSRQRLKILDNDVLQVKSRAKSLGAEDITKLPGSDKSIDEIKTIVEQLQQNLNRTNADLQAEQSAMQVLQAQESEKTAAFDSVKTWLDAHQAESFLMEDFPELERLKTIRNELKSLNEKNKSYQQWSQSTTTALQKNKQELERLEKKLKRSVQKIQDTKEELETVTQGLSAEEIEDLYNDQQERVVLFKDLINLAQGNKKLDSSGLIKSMISKPELDLEAIQAEFNDKSNELVMEKNILNTLERAVANEALLKKYQVERVLLVDDEPCPLCGSLQHPYADISPSMKSSAKALADQQAKLKILQPALDKLQKQLNVAQTQHDKNTQREKDLSKIKSQWVATCNRLNAAGEDMHIGNFSLMKSLLHEEKDELKRVAGMHGSHRQLQSRLHKLQTSIESGEGLLTQLKQSVQKQEQDWNDRPQELKELEVSLKDCNDESTQLSEKISEQLATLDLKLPKVGKEDVLIDKLKAARQEYNSYFIRDKNFNSDMQELRDALQNKQVKVQALRDAIASYSEDINELELASLNRLLQEKRQSIHRQEEEIKPLEETEAAYLQALQEKINASKVSSLEELREMLALIQSKDTLQQNGRKLSNEIESLDATLEKEKGQLDTTTSLRVTEYSYAELDELEKSLRQKRDICQQEITRLKKREQEYKTLEGNRQQLQDALQEQQAVVQQRADDVADIEKDSGIVFRRKVQKKMADKLIVSANAYLEKIGGRYYLHQLDTRQGIAMEVEDTYKNNTRRLPKTLSGGETFVVSLALALALSDLANNGQSLDSIFIDEGFGNLDDEALYLVVSTLKSLHMHGKTVGIISHIQGVKERIGTQIEMSRNPNGTSGFAVVS